MDGDGGEAAELPDVRILGPLEVRLGGRLLALGGRRQQAVLACLTVSTTAGVSVDRLADALWGEHVPPAYLSTVQTYVYHLREILEPTRVKGAAAHVLVTTPAGYRLDVPDDNVDARRFERLVAEGQRAVASDPARASQLLARALALWRDDVLPDFSDLEPVAREAGRLDELRQAAYEGWTGAELALGHHSAILPELGRLVSTYPLREGLHAQRMLALYRDGRQIEALAVFRQLRASLDEELGVEPARSVQELHRRVLDHDPALDWTPSSAAAPTAVPGPAPTGPAPTGLDATIRPSADVLGPGTRSRRRPRRWVAVSAIVVVGLALLTGTVLRVGSSSHVVPVPANVVAILSTSGLEGRAVQLTDPAVALAEGGGALWALDEMTNALLRIDPTNPLVTETIGGVGGSPQSLAVDGNDVWVAGFDDGIVTRVNTVTRRVVDTIPVGIQPAAVVARDGQVWVANSGDNTVQRIDPRKKGSASASAPIDVGTGPTGLALDGRTLWVANSRGGSVTTLDTASGERVRADVPVPAGPHGLAVTKDDLWVVGEVGQAVSRISRDTGRVVTIPVEDGPSSVVVLDGYAWVNNASSGSVSRIEIATNAVTRILVGSAPRALALVGGRVWVSTAAYGNTEHLGGLLAFTTSAGTLGDSIDPASAYTFESRLILRPVYDGLVSFRSASGLASQTLVPDLATSIPEPVDGGRTYVFTIRPGVRYSTGGEVVASDFVRGLRRAVAGRGNPDLFSAVVGVPSCLKAAGDRTVCELAGGVSADDSTRRVTFRLSHPDPDFLHKLTFFVVPTPAGTGLTDRGMIASVPGTGPYQISDVAKDGSLTLVRNPFFQQWSFAAQPYGYPDRIQHQVVASEAQGIADVLDGKADLVIVPPSEMSSLAGHDQLVKRYTFPRTDFVYLNSHVAPFDDRRARQALDYAVDRRVFPSLYGGENRAGAAVASCGLLPPGFPAYRPYCPHQSGPATGDYLGPDLERAKALVRESGTRDVPITVWAYHGRQHRQPAWDAFPPYLVRVLRSIGYRNVKVQDIPDEHARGEPDDTAYRTYQIFTQQGWVADYPGPQTFYDLFSCTNPDNLSRYCNTVIDDVAREANDSAVTDPGRSLELWRKVDRLLTDDAAFVALGRPQHAVLVSTKVRSVQLSPLVGPLLSQMWVR